MRLRISRTLLKRLLIVATYLYVIIHIWMYLPYIMRSDKEKRRPSSSSSSSSSINVTLQQSQLECGLKHLPCVIDSKKKIECVQERDEVYFPFSFLEKRFEVYGTYSPDGARFAMDTSIGRVPESVPKYDPTGSHADDITYFVEGRPYVIYVDGIQGVPLCRQWFPEGFFFSTNIAQFGLSHYSKHFVNPNPKFLMVVEKGSMSCEVKPSKSSIFKQTRLENFNQTVYFKTSSSPTSEGIKITFSEAQEKQIKMDKLSCVTVYGKLTANSSLTFEVFRTSDEKVYNLIYIANNNRLHAYDQTVIVGIGNRDMYGMNRWSRTLYVDLEHGIFHRDGLNKERINDNALTRSVRVRSITLRGEGYLYKLMLANNVHLEHFNDAARWMLKNQDDMGGWPMPVSHDLGTYQLKPGWYTALGQGLGMSVLCRAYYLTKKDVYLKACAKSTKVFHIPNEKGGVRAVFLDKYVWYEEYPTIPPSFVLNGFMTAMLGLYDLSQIGRDSDATRLFNDGMVSLKALLPLFDSGSRSLYDLRHITMHTDPNRCRWDYHNVHIELLMHFYTIDNASIFKEFAERWKKYRNGWMVKHN